MKQAKAKHARWGHPAHKKLRLVRLLNRAVMHAAKWGAGLALFERPDGGACQGVVCLWCESSHRCEITEGLPLLEQAYSVVCKTYRSSTDTPGSLVILVQT